MTVSAALRAQLSRRIRGATPPDWNRFGSLWMAFNAMYRGDPDSGERARVMSAVRRHFSEARARTLLRQCDVPLQRILAIPPGNMLYERWNPNFRRRSRDLARIVEGAGSARERLAAAAGILYQVRCNLIHGEKDPQQERDRMLVRESVRVLEVLVPELEDALDVH